MQEKETAANIGKNIPKSRQETEKDILKVIDQWDCAGRPITKKKIGEYRADGTNQTEYSMAHEGVERPAMLTINKRGSWLELTIRPVKARSRVDGKEMEGQLYSLKYFMSGELIEAKKKGGRLRIPLEACRVQKSRKGKIKGGIVITVACTAGNAHMPESTAYLMFWL